MALDRFVKFGERHPTREQVDVLLRDFLGTEEVGTVEWSRDRFLVTLRGHPSFPFRQLEPDVADPHAGGGRERWIEVWIARGGRKVDVMTRMMDDYTCAVADQIVELLARYWGGEVEEEDDDEPRGRAWADDVPAPGRPRDVEFYLADEEGPVASPSWTASVCRWLLHVERELGREREALRDLLLEYEAYDGNAAQGGLELAEEVAALLPPELREDLPKRLGGSRDG